MAPPTEAGECKSRREQERGIGKDFTGVVYWGRRVQLQTARKTTKGNIQEADPQVK